MEPNNIRNGWDEKLLQDRWIKDVAERARWLHMFRVNAICPGYIETPSSPRKSTGSPLRRSRRRQKIAAALKAAVENQFLSLGTSVALDVDSKVVTGEIQWG